MKRRKELPEVLLRRAEKTAENAEIITRRTPLPGILLRQVKDMGELRDDFAGTSRILCKKKPPGFST